MAVKRAVFLGIRAVTHESTVGATQLAVEIQDFSATYVTKPYLRRLASFLLVLRFEWELHLHAALILSHLTRSLAVQYWETPKLLLAA